MPRPFVWSVVIALALTAPTAAQTRRSLPMGTAATATVTVDAPTEFSLPATSAGALSVAVQGDGDLSIQLLDEDGQVLPDATADRDLSGNEGTELLSTIISQTGDYRVRVRLQGGSKSSFTVVGGFVPFAAFERPADSDRRPGAARVVAVGTAVEDSLDPSKGDVWDWYVLKPTVSGTLTVVTRPVGGGEPPDLVLEIYTDGTFDDAKDRSDQDLQENTANESVTVDVKAGDAVHVRVSGHITTAEKYRLSSSLAP